MTKIRVDIPFVTVPSVLEFAVSAKKENSFRATIVSGGWQCYTILLVEKMKMKVWHIKPPLHAWEDRGVQWVDMLYLLILMNLVCLFKVSKVLKASEEMSEQSGINNPIRTPT